MAQRIVLSLAADLTGAWQTSNGDILEVLKDFHVMGDDFLEKWVARLHSISRPDQL